MEVSDQSKLESGGVLTAPDEAGMSMTHKTLLHFTETIEGSEHMLGTRHILLPVDDTADSELAVTWAIENVYKQGMDVFHLLHVIPEPQMLHVWAGVYVPPDDDVEEREVEDTKVFVKHRFAALLKANRIPFQLHIIVGTCDSASVATVIQKKAEDIGAELIVMAKHQKGKLREMFMGSVTMTVSKSSATPVAVVPPLL